MAASMYTGEDIIINGTVFNRIDEVGNRWIITDLDGWWGLPEPTVPDDPRPFQEDGSYFATGRYEARQIVVSGYIVPGSGAEGEVTDARGQALLAARARDALNRSMNIIRSTAIMQVNETDQPKIAAVQLVAKPLTKFNDSRNILEFNFQLKSSDPRKYALDATVTETRLQSAAEGRTYNRVHNYQYGAPGSDGRMTVTNEGSYNTFGVLTIRGPVVHPSIEHIELGRTISFDLSLGETDFLEINLKNKTAMLNGVESRRNKLDPGSAWFWFLPGTNSLRFTGHQVVSPRPEYPAVTNLATNPSFETPYGDNNSRINSAANPRALSTISALNDPPTGWTYTPGTGETGLLLAGGRSVSPDGTEVRRNYERNPQAIGPVTGAVGGYGGSIANFGTFVDGTSGLTALLVPGSTYVTRTNYARDPRASQGYSSSGTGWTYTAGTGETGVGVSPTQTAVTRTNLYINPKFAAPEANSGTYYDGYSDTDPFLGTCFTIVRTGGLNTNPFGAGLESWAYTPSTQYTVSFKVRAVGQNLTGSNVVPVYFRPVGQDVTTGQILLGTIDQNVGDAVTYVFTGTTSGTAAVDPSITLAVPASWGAVDDVIMVTDVLVEPGQTDGSFFYGDTPETNLALDRHVAYRWTGGTNTSASEAVESLQQNAAGPDGTPGFVRRYLLTPKSTGTSGWVYYDTDATLSAVNGDNGIASLYVRSTSAITVRLQLERYTSGGVIVGTVESGSSVALVPNTWTRISVADTADGTAARFLVRLDIVTDGVSTALPRGTIIDATELLMERGTALRDYFDGDSTDVDLPNDRTIQYSWTSTVGDSASTVGETITDSEEGVTGPTDAISSFARAVIVQPKTSGVSGWEGRSASVVTPVTVAAGERYSVSLYARYAGSSGSIPVSLEMAFQSVAGTDGSTRSSGTVNLTSGDWIRLSVSGVANVARSYIGWSLRSASGDIVPVDSIIDVSGVLIERIETLTSPARTNLFRDPFGRNESYSETGTTGGAQTTGTIIANPSGSGFLITAPSSGNWRSPLRQFTAAALTTYTVRMMLTSSATQTLTLVYRYNTVGSSTNSVTLTPASLTAGVPFEYVATFTTQSPTPVVDGAGISIVNTTFTTGSTVVVDGVVIRQGTFTAPDMQPFDGSTTETSTFAYSWTGSESTSTSNEYAIVAPTTGSYFDGNTQPTPFSLDRIHAYSWAASATASASIAKLTVEAYAAGPLEVPGLARWQNIGTKTSGTAEMTYAVVSSVSASATGVSGTYVTGSVWVRSTASVAATPVVRLYNNGSLVNTFTGTVSGSLADGAWQRISASGMATSAFNGVRVTAQLPAAQVLGREDVFDASSVLIDVGSSALRGYFDGGVKGTGSEGETAWAGLEHHSQSTLTARGIKLFGSVAAAMTSNNDTYQIVYQATSWSVYGDYSLGHTVTSSPTEDTYARPAGTASGLTRLGMTPGQTYTLSGFINIPAVQAGTLSSNARKIALLVTAPSLGGGSQVYYSDQAPNTPGVYRLSLTVSLPSDTTDVSLRLIHGAMSGTVFWDSVMIEPGSSMSADYFDGDSPFGEWTGTAHDSSSERPLIPEIKTATAEVMIRSAWIE